MNQEEIDSEGMQQAWKDGWLDIHGGGSTGGAYWRGINPETKRVVELPDKYTKLIPEYRDNYGE